MSHNFSLSLPGCSGFLGNCSPILLRSDVSFNSRIPLRRRRQGAVGPLPLAAINLRNLVPMGMKCNALYKLAQDILRDAAGVRRWSFDPYADRQITVILDNSVPFGGADGQTPTWQIDFDPDSIECKTWDNVFHVRERIKRDVLDSSFWQWLRDFSAWFKKRMGIAAQEIPSYWTHVHLC